MRTQLDRLRHTILFEGIGLITVVPLAAWILGRDLTHIGVMAVFMSTAAMLCNYVFNVGFDLTLRAMGRPLDHRPPPLRVLHAVLFETSFMLVTLPAVSWWLDLSLAKAFMTNAGFAGFYLVYTYVYNWVYDRVFPMPVDDEDTGGAQPARAE